MKGHKYVNGETAGHAKVMPMDVDENRQVALRLTFVIGFSNFGRAFALTPDEVNCCLPTSYMLCVAFIVKPLQFCVASVCGAR